MRLSVIQRILGQLLISFSLSLLPPIGVSLWYQDDQLIIFIILFLMMFFLGIVCWFPARQAKQELLLHDGFVITAGFWIILSLLSALPFLFTPHLDFAKSVFEAVSGFTTTGATVISGLDELPKSLLYYRQQLQWFGGLGIIVFAIAVLPMLGIGGMQLYRAETPGPMHDDKLAPRLRYTAEYLLYVYIILTVACALAYWWAGMGWFDAICHSFSTLSTGGFSTHDASLGYFNSPVIEIIAMIFMVLGSLNFAVHFIAWRKLDMRHYWNDIQGRVFLFIVLFISSICIVILMLSGVYSDFWTALRYSSFQLISMISTTGFLTADFSNWPSILPVLILASGFIGGCVGSTAGGFRVIRFILLYKQAMRGIMRLIHPHAFLAIKVGQRRVSNDIVQAVGEYSVLYMASYLFLSLLFMATGVDMISAFSGVAACFNMVGPGLGEVAVTYGSVSDTGLWILSFAMLLGRLEIYALLVLLMPAFWQK